MEGLLQSDEGQGESHIQAANRRSADRLHEILREDRAGGKVAGGPGAGRLHPHHVATGFRQPRRFASGTAGQDFPQRPDLASRLRNTGRRHLLPVLRVDDSGVGEAESCLRPGVRAWASGVAGTKNLDPNKGYPGIRYVLLHTFAHALIRQLAIECGYTQCLDHGADLFPKSR